MGNKKKNNQKKISQKKKSFKWEKPAKRSMITLCFIAIISIPLYFLSKQNEIEHDLSVIGNGRVATVVQTYDYNCQDCTQLKRNISAVKKNFENDMEFKLVNLNTDKGSKFADEYNVSYATMLLFDKKGKLISATQGVSNQNEIKESLTAFSLLKYRP
jgi:hypothetical protein